MTRFGLSVALTTPFDENGDIVLDMMLAQVRRGLAGGCNSCTLFGTTGEGSSIGHQERERVLSAVLDAGVAPEQIVVGVLVDSAEDAAEQARLALDRGVRNILLAPPSYFKNVSDEGLFRWFSRVFSLLGSKARDILVYNIPSVTMVKLSVPLVARLREAFPGIVTGVKDSGGDWDHTQALLKDHSDLIILIGDERHLAQGVRMGGQGAISGVANFAPQEVGAMANEGRDDPRVVELVVALLKHPVTPAVKAMVARELGDQKWLAVRAPLLSTSTDVQNELGHLFDGLFRTKAA
ncbi:dihydrodipicolinate synthase family protein [Rhizobiales bacterium RZME27]|uniref:Dihydrodipicolinate synthase family protein n=1 Tax=Endobacterium cereale TaxID=2663029 RepID=A0A6A8ADD9_9HYPH|nr:dihydrodipicolinate synthase family protein [Endobacterium cereale]MEB2848500.1 dihydrodipicolinate synthase family protein [Endobacterium cereale]MQY49335.1 dihydrodipicolinate synthase family protein [Endobacterium cereale]